MVQVLLPGSGTLVSFDNRRLVKAFRLGEASANALLNVLPVDDFDVLAIRRRVTPGDLVKRFLLSHES